MAAPLPRIQRANAGLVVVDLQERLLPSIFGSERLVRNVKRLLKAATILRVPILVTEQYQKGLGPTIEEIRRLIPSFAPFHKLTFSACRAEGFMDAVRQKKFSQVVLCGIEAHVCVLQTGLDFLEQGVTAFVVADAVSSRTTENHHIGLERMRGAGAVIVSTEMILFELLEKSGTDEFKQIIELVK